MTKLEKKLIKLGYKKDFRLLYGAYHKKIKEPNITCIFKVDCYNEKILDYWVESYIQNNDDLKQNKQAFNILQNDLKELKEYE